nr:energy-coupling factor transporter transmembrane component T [uncultured Blautia sp.]
MRQDIFSSFHPSINFLYFVLVIGCSMFVMHPVFLGLSCAGGMAYYVYLKHWKALKTALWLMLPVFLISAAVNPLFNHQGITLLFYLKNGNPMTLESILYGLAAGAMLVCVLNWFSCYQVVMTSDKFIYLFGKVIPAMSLILSMVLRFVPRFKTQITKISDSQKCIGRDVTNGNVLARAKHGMKILSVMTTWALENSVETADSMKSRGYGLRGRNNFSIYRFDTRDKVFLLCLLLLGGGVLAGILTKSVHFLYYPMLQMNENTIGAALVYVCYGILCFLPVIMNITEDIKWHYMKSKI